MFYLNPFFKVMLLLPGRFCTQARAKEKEKDHVSQNIPRLTTFYSTERHLPRTRREKLQVQLPADLIPSQAPPNPIEVDCTDISSSEPARHQQRGGAAHSSCPCGQ
jgi:hypothetical protein